MPFKIALITGTGMDHLFSKENGFQVELGFRKTTPYGGPVRYYTVRKDELEFLWVDRHNSTGRYCCPHEINPMAYMYVLAQQNVQYILATTAVGGLNTCGMSRIEVGSLVIPSDFIDLTGGSYTFANSQHSHPTAFYCSTKDLFCPSLANLFQDTKVVRGGILTCIPGPRYETRAEIEFLIAIHKGIRLLGMTTVKEVPLAREIAAHYCPVAIVADLPLEEKSIKGDAVDEAGKQSRGLILETLIPVIRQLSLSHLHPHCECARMPSVFQILGI